MELEKMEPWNIVDLFFLLTQSFSGSIVEFGVCISLSWFQESDVVRSVLEWMDLRYVFFEKLDC